MTETYVPYIANNALAHAKAAEFELEWLATLGARAKLMRPDNRLMRCAADHAAYLASRMGDQLLQSMHVGEGGSYSNGRVLASGYKLPSAYSPLRNNVESCARDAGGPDAALAGLLASPAHHDHLMGIGGFSDRVVYGIGQSGDDWVVLICPVEA